jgi:hypothetical protein
MTDTDPALKLFSPEEVRDKACALLDRAAAGELKHVGVDPDRLGRAVEKVLESIRETYPEFQIPPYGIWRDFEAGGIERWEALAGARGFGTAEEMLVAAADLAILGSFMMTARPEGRTYEDPMTGTVVTGRTASALAAFHMFAAGSFSSHMSDPYRVDAETLIRLDLKELAGGLQWDEGEDGDYLRAMQRHLQRLGEALALRPDLFGEGGETRPGLLVAHAAREGEGSVDAGELLDRLLEALAPVWEGGAGDGDLVFGDSFRHSGLPGPVPGADLESIVPFHLAAQEMVYSLVEPLAWAGSETTGLNRLTGPSDLAHAALFAETGVLAVRDGEAALAPEAQRDRMIELRGVTIALIDRLAGRLAGELGVSADQVPLTCVLEGGTGRAGRHILKDHPELERNLGKILNPGAVFWLPFGA